MPRWAGASRTDHIAFANCGKPTSASQNSTGLRKVPVRERGGDTQLGQKLAVGVLGGVGGGLVGAAFAFGWVLPAIQSQREAEPGTDPSAAYAIADAGTILLGFWGGNLVGTAIGVSAVDPQDNFLVTLTGSALLGAGVPVAIALTEWEYGAPLAFLSIVFGPIVGATIASEVWRKPLSAKLHLKPKAPLVSVDLVPNPKGGLSAVATLRF